MLFCHAHKKSTFQFQASVILILVKWVYVYVLVLVKFGHKMRRKSSPDFGGTFNQKRLLGLGFSNDFLRVKRQAQSPKTIRGG